MQQSSAQEPRRAVGEQADPTRCATRRVSGSRGGRCTFCRPGPGTCSGKILGRSTASAPASSSRRRARLSSRVPFLYLFPAVMGINGVFMAQPVSDLLALVLCVLLVIREQRTLYAKLPAGAR